MTVICNVLLQKMLHFDTVVLFLCFFLCLVVNLTWLHEKDTFTRWKHLLVAKFGEHFRHFSFYGGIFSPQKIIGCVNFNIAMKHYGGNSA
jgi:hypothetical protein